MPEGEQPDPEHQALLEAAFQEGMGVGQFLLRTHPDHATHSSPEAIMYFIGGAIYAEVAKGVIPMPMTREEGQRNIDVVQAFIKGVVTSYNLAHGAGQDQQAPQQPAAPSKPKDDGLPPMYG